MIPKPSPKHLALWKLPKKKMNIKIILLITIFILGLIWLLTLHSVLKLLPSSYYTDTHLLRSSSTSTITSTITPSQQYHLNPSLSHRTIILDTQTTYIITYTIRLSIQPSTPITIIIQNNPTNDIKLELSPRVIVIDPAAWKTPHSITARLLLFDDNNIPNNISNNITISQLSHIIAGDHESGWESKTSVLPSTIDIVIIIQNINQQTQSNKQCQPEPLAVTCWDPGSPRCGIQRNNCKQEVQCGKCPAPCHQKEEEQQHPQNRNTPIMQQWIAKDHIRVVDDIDPLIHKQCTENLLESFRDVYNFVTIVHQDTNNQDIPNYHNNNTTPILQCFGRSFPVTMHCTGDNLYLDTRKIDVAYGGEDVLSVMGRLENSEIAQIQLGALYLTIPENNKNNKKIIMCDNPHPENQYHTDENKIGAQLQSMRYMGDFLRSICGSGYHASVWADQYRAKKEKRITNHYPPWVGGGNFTLPDTILNHETNTTLIQEQQNEITLIVARFEYVNLYHTATELFSAYMALRLAGVNVNTTSVQVLFLDGHADGLIDEVWGDLFGGKVIRVGHIRTSSKPILKFNKVVFAGLGYSADINIHKSDTPSQSTKTASYTCWRQEIRDFADILIHRLNLQDIKPIKNRVSFILRDQPTKPSHPRAPKDKDQRLQRTERRVSNPQELHTRANIMNNKGYDVQILSLSTMKLRDQIRAIRESEIVFGLHGAGLTHLLWARETLTIELSPATFQSRIHFRKLASRIGARFMRIIGSKIGPSGSAFMGSTRRMTTLRGRGVIGGRLGEGGGGMVSFSINGNQFEGLVRWGLEMNGGEVMEVGNTEASNINATNSLFNIKPQEKPTTTQQSKMNTTITPKKQKQLLQLNQTFHQNLNQLITNLTIVIPTLDQNKHKLGIIVPFRDGCGKLNQGDGRLANLKEFIETIPRHFERVRKAGHKPPDDWEIIVVEQTQSGLFNKGALFNTGVVMCIGCDYFVLHDVDQVPESVENTYEYPKNHNFGPIHMCSASSQFGYKMAYGTMVGGALMMTREQFVRVNGFSVGMFGWGREDDEMYERIRRVYGRLTRLMHDKGRYKALDHPRVKDLDITKAFQESGKKLKLARNGFVRQWYMNDGLLQLDSSIGIKGMTLINDRVCLYSIDVYGSDGC